MSASRPPCRWPLCETAVQQLHLSDDILMDLAGQEGPRRFNSQANPASCHCEDDMSSPIPSTPPRVGVTAESVHQLRRAAEELASMMEGVQEVLASAEAAMARGIKVGPDQHEHIKGLIRQVNDAAFPWNLPGDYQDGTKEVLL